jgi:DNA-binding SARP family transcriptional activator
LVRGDFLDRILAWRLRSFDEWLFFSEHSRADDFARGTAAAFHERAGQLPEAERIIRRLLEYEPLRESAYRQLMRVLARADRRNAALDVYETCRRCAGTELGLAPAVETMTLAEQIRARAPFEVHSDAGCSAACSYPLFWAPARIRAPGRFSVAPNQSGW